MRPFDGGDDGLFYDGVGRIILQRLLSGDIAGFLQGGENVFYYGGPGLRYFRALEHIVFGESYLGYLTLVLLLPFLVYGLLRRFLPGRWPLASAIIFTAIPVGALFGTTFFQYAQWAGRGFADPAAYILFTAGLLVLVRATGKFPAAFSAALLFALAIFMKPIVAPAAAVLLGGAGIGRSRGSSGRASRACASASCRCSPWPCTTGCSAMSSCCSAPIPPTANLLVMPPSAWLAARPRRAAGRPRRAADRALAERPRADRRHHPGECGSRRRRSSMSLASRRFDPFDPWLRLIAGAALAQHAVALFYDASTARYHFLAWLLTLPVGLVWLQQVGIVWLQRRYPDLCLRIASQPLSLWLASGLARLHKVSS